MANRESAFIEITPEVLLKAYACGIFPMAESAEDPALYWIEPEKRGIIPLDTQFVTDHLKTFGAVEVPRRQYHKLLETALAGEGDFAALGGKRPVTGAQALGQLAAN